ncbi:MAG: hypothetical protein V1848_03720 [Candidatus Magasanikbacteria bacterium]
MMKALCGIILVFLAFKTFYHIFEGLERNILRTLILELLHKYRGEKFYTSEIATMINTPHYFLLSKVLFVLTTNRQIHHERKLFYPGHPQCRFEDVFWVDENSPPPQTQ